MAVCSTRPPRLGHPESDAVSIPTNDIKESTAPYRKGEDININKSPPTMATIHLSFEDVDDDDFRFMRARKSMVKTTPWTMIPARLGHPSASAITSPIADVAVLVRVYRYGEATNRNSSPEMKATVHLSLDV